jgi:hypothetical protein
MNCGYAAKRAPATRKSSPRDSMSALKPGMTASGASSTNEPSAYIRRAMICVGDNPLAPWSHATMKIEPFQAMPALPTVGPR